MKMLLLAKSLFAKKSKIFSYLGDDEEIFSFLQQM
jgi:hypothetical protein